MNIGETIAAIRKRKNMKQGELAQKANVTQSYLSQLEQNKKDPNVKTLQSIAEALNIPLPVLFFLSITDDDIPKEKRDSYSALSPIVKSFIENIFISDLK